MWVVTVEHENFNGAYFAYSLDEIKHMRLVAKNLCGVYGKLISFEAKKLA